IETNYHFGGYAKKTLELEQLIDKIKNQYHIPLDFVYTAKMMAGIFDLIAKDYFESGSRILAIHTGGLRN
ncbi:MAG TPA: 1-aminocyclopropane-1-carboxylate deaminase, partial [Cytophagales bacterium]|nr:1-aminocyclopropane-1-carboxylate deaminase [Cytophagales bacterium]